MFSEIRQLCENLSLSFGEISSERKETLQKLSRFIQEKHDNKLAINLTFICTHNSRRSHFGQIWSKLAADFYSIHNVHTFSGGTESTAFNPNAIEALKELDFEIKQLDESQNPKYKVSFSDDNSVTCFSKLHDDSENPKTNFAAVMTCSEADENCPYIAGAEQRFTTTYTDPKTFDGTSKQQEKYLESCKLIALECLYTFSLIKK